MTISSSLNAGIAGLSANASRLASISDNIANANTHGYKRVRTDFESIVVSPNGGKYSAGGVRPTSRRMVDERGPLVSTSNSTDLAVRGRGFLPVASAVQVNADNGNVQMMLTTTGSFRTDADGYLKSESGLVLMGWPALSDGTIPNYPSDTADALAPVRINVNEFTGEPTTTVGVGVNLPATATEAGAPGTPQELSIEYFDNLGKSESLRINFIPLVPATGASNEWTMQIEDSAQPGVVIGEYEVTFDDSRTGGGQLASVTPISGGPYDGVEGTVLVNVAGGPMEVFIGELGGDSGLSQLSDRFAPVELWKDGTPVGNLNAVEVDANGFVKAFFDSGITKTVFKIPLVDLPNPNGMIAIDEQVYKPSTESGTYFVWDAGEGPTGDIISYAREESAVDVAGELTSMIQTQRAYSSNAKVIQTVDEMLQETANIKR